MAESDRLSIASSVVTVVHSLEYENTPKSSHHDAETSDFILVGTDNVFEPLSHCSTDEATQERFQNTPPQYSGLLTEEGYTGVDSTTTINASASAQATKLLPHSSPLSSGYITTKGGVFFDSASPCLELPRVSTAQCYDGETEINTNVLSPCGSELMQDYVDADFSVPRSSHLPGSAHNSLDIYETEGESSSMHELFGSLFVVEEIHNSSGDSCSPSEQSSRTTSPYEDNADTIRYKRNISPGYIEFQSIIRQDIVLDHTAGQEMQYQPDECDACALTPDLYQHQRQTDDSADRYMDPHSIEDSEPHDSRSDQLTRLSKCHGSTSSIDSGYVRTCDFS